MLPLHPVCQNFPKFTMQELDALRESVRELGILTPALTWNGMIIDGRHRAIVAEELGIKLPTREVGGTEAMAIAEAYAENLIRRNSLTTSQRAKLTVEYKEAVKAAKRSHVPAAEIMAAIEHPKPAATVMPAYLREAAAAAGASARIPAPPKPQGLVSDSTARRWRRLCHKATAQVVQAVDQGRMSIGQAAILAKEDHDVQIAAMKMLKSQQAKDVADAICMARGERKQYDAYGRAVPLCGVMAWDDRKTLMHWRMQLANLITWLNEIKADPSRCWQFQGANVVQEAKNLKELLIDATPECVCPYCDQAGKFTSDCKACGGYGLLNKSALLAVPKDLLGERRQ